MACASLNALCVYLEKNYNLRLEGDVSLTYHYSRDYMSIDAQTCKSLSLFPEAMSSKYDKEGLASQFCLLNIFKPKTSIGKKTLRRRIFSPSSNSEKINSWYSYLDKLLALKTSDADNLRNNLQKVSNIDIALS